MSAMNYGRVYCDSYFNSTVNSKFCQTKFVSPLLEPKSRGGFSRREELLEPKEPEKLADVRKTFHLSSLSHKKDIPGQFVLSPSLFCSTHKMTSTY